MNSLNMTYNQNAVSDGVKHVIVNTVHSGMETHHINTLRMLWDHYRFF
jgi:hypothetical protein